MPLWALSYMVYPAWLLPTPYAVRVLSFVGLSLYVGVTMWFFQKWAETFERESSLPQRVVRFREFRKDNWVVLAIIAVYAGLHAYSLIGMSAVS